MKPRVAVFSTRFLAYSETFIYDELQQHRRYEAHVFCARHVHGDQFPYPRVFVGGRIYRHAHVSPAFHRRIATGGYALIHAHFGFCGVHAVPFARRHRLPLIVTFHGHDVSLLASGERLYPKFWRYALLGPSLLRHLTLGLCASVELYEILRELGVPAERLRLHHIGVDIERFSPGPRAERSEPLVVMVGRFVPKKGFVYGIRAFAKARRASGRGSLMIVGDGELRSQLENAVREEGIGAHVTFTGIQQHDRIAALLASADVLLAPSVTTADGDRESGLIVAKEASAAGTVPVSTWHGGIPEIVEDGRTGFLVPERDVNGMADRLGILLADTDLRRRMGEAARAKMLAEYDNRRRVAALEDVYDAVLSQSNGARGVRP
jgi:colanic acid/amylovoran biosynthesis glycosyltransferase